MLSPSCVRVHGRFRRVAVAALTTCCILLGAIRLVASDHADPIDLWRLQPLEPVITDLFAFPVDDDGKPFVSLDPDGNTISTFVRSDKLRLQEPDLAPRPELTADERERIKGLVVILCVRRDLADSESLDLEGYRYQIHMDTRTRPSYVDAPRDAGTAESEPSDHPHESEHRKLTIQEARVRYGGLIERPDKIEDDVIIEIGLANDASLSQFTVVKGLTCSDDDVAKGTRDPERISVWTGIRDDPFIFPAFFRTNVVAMVVYIPNKCFRPGQRDWLIWATSHCGSEQIDHVGRSLRTQNPRFEELNTLHPRDHVAAIVAEHVDPSLMRDLALRFNVQTLFAFREWDFVPDVMIYTNRYPVGFPNGRLLTDDVAAILAQHGDTLLFELSHHNAQWPRVEQNFDKPFLDGFPYLAEPWTDPRPAEPHHLSWKNTLKLIALGVVFVLFLLLAASRLWQIVRRWFGARRPRETYL